MFHLNCFFSIAVCLRKWLTNFLLERNTFRVRKTIISSTFLIRVGVPLWIGHCHIYMEGYFTLSLQCLVHCKKKKWRKKNLKPIAFFSSITINPTKTFVKNSLLISQVWTRRALLIWKKLTQLANFQLNSQTFNLMRKLSTQFANFQLNLQTFNSIRKLSTQFANC